MKELNSTDIALIEERVPNILKHVVTIEHKLQVIYELAVFARDSDISRFYLSHIRNTKDADNISLKSYVRNTHELNLEYLKERCLNHYKRRRKHTVPAEVQKSVTKFLVKLG